MEVICIYALITGFILDRLFGDPKTLPHLIVGYGFLISKGEHLFNRGKYLLFKGGFLTIGLIFSVYIFSYYLLNHLQHNFPLWLTYLVYTIIIFYCIANQTLITEGKNIFFFLKNNMLDEARKQLAHIVGRDTKTLDAQGIKRATFESMSENLSDGVIAPLFYFALFGIPGIMTYKMINTLDSMIGYRNIRYEQFGKVAAKIDDIANFLPSRLCALLMLIVSKKMYYTGIWQVFSEAKKHNSPNAGYPESALAYILSCQLGGPSVYNAVIHNKAYIGKHQRDIKNEEIYTVSNINYKTSVLCVLLIIVYYAVLYYA